MRLAFVMAPLLAAAVASAVGEEAKKPINTGVQENGDSLTREADRGENRNQPAGTTVEKPKDTPPERDAGVEAATGAGAEGKPRPLPSSNTEGTSGKPKTRPLPESNSADVPEDPDYFDFVFAQPGYVVLTALLSAVLTLLLLFSLGLVDGGCSSKGSRGRGRDDTPPMGVPAWPPRTPQGPERTHHGPPPSMWPASNGGGRPAGSGNASFGGPRPGQPVPSVVADIERQMASRGSDRDPVLLQPARRRDFISDAAPAAWREFFNADGGRNRGSAKALEAAFRAHDLMATVIKHPDISTLAIVTHQGLAYAFPLSQGFANIAEYFEAAGASRFSIITDMAQPAVVDPRSHRPQLRGLVTLE